MVVIAFDPDHLEVALRVRELANEAEKLPVFFFQAPEIEVGKNIAEQNEAAIPGLLQDAQGLARAAHVRAEMQIREDQRVVNRRRHSPIVATPCYRSEERRVG